MIYLDNAATSFPKPHGVTEEQARCLREYCGNAGRGSHSLAMAAAEKLYECRTLISELVNAPAPDRVAFTMNTTMALNFAIKGFLHEDDHVLISDMDHNATFRPVYRLAKEGKVTYDVFPTFPTDPTRSTQRICQHIEALIKPQTRMLICAHASNICSAILPIAEIGTICRQKGIVFVVDAAQSAGHIPIDMQRMQIDVLCAPGHKGLLGPQGIGFWVLGEGLVANTLLEGGSGYNSLDGAMPDDAPERYEAGTLPTPAIAGLCEGIRTVNRLGIEEIGKREAELNACLARYLSAVPGVQIYAPHHLGAVLLFNAEGISADRMGYELNRRGFCVRAGYHCAALAHTTLQTRAGGAVRVSPGIFNTKEQMYDFARAVHQIMREFP